MSEVKLPESFKAEHFGKRLKAVIKRRGLTQREVSKSLNLTEAAISQMCHGMYFPALDTIVLMCKLLNVSMDFLIIGEVE